MIRKYIQVNFSEKKTSKLIEWLFPVFAWIAILLVALFLFYFLLPIIFLGMIAHLVFKYFMMRKFNEVLKEATNSRQGSNKDEKIIDITLEK